MNSARIASTIAAVGVLICSNVRADCVIGAKGALKYQVLDSHVIVLMDGTAGYIMIKSFSFFYPNSQVSVLKDSFCDFQSEVLYVDGSPVDVQQVKQLR